MLLTNPTLASYSVSPSMAGSNKVATVRSAPGIDPVDWHMPESAWSCVQNFCRAFTSADWALIGSA
ncbi:hypothetical protein D3C80_1610900 [compost metagenome]